jgi:hypothetical protein
MLKHRNTYGYLSVAVFLQEVMPLERLTKVNFSRGWYKAPWQKRHVTTMITLIQVDLMFFRH